MIISENFNPGDSLGKITIEELRDSVKMLITIQDYQAGLINLIQKRVKKLEEIILNDD